MSSPAEPLVYNVTEWVAENEKFFLPPVCNKMMHNNGQMKLFFVGGPNQRKDYHIEAGEELFFMLKGDMLLKVVEHGKHKDIPIKEGQIFLLPSHIAHSPQRDVNTLGLVIERERKENEQDGLRYFVEKDGIPTTESLYEAWFHCTDLGSQLAPIIKGYFASEPHKTGKPIPGTIPENPPIVLDSERSLVQPFYLLEWIKENKADLDAKGSISLFDDSHQFQVFVCGEGESNGLCEQAETWAWQIEGSSVFTVDDKEHSLGPQDSLLIKAGQRYSSRRGEDSYTLVCYQDPSRKCVTAAAPNMG